MYIRGAKNGLKVAQSRAVHSFISTMKSLILSLLALASSTTAHYTFPELVVGGKGTGNWQYVRQTANYQSNGKSFSLTLSQPVKLTTPLRSRDRRLLQRYPLLPARTRDLSQDNDRQRWRYRRIHRRGLSLAPRTHAILHGQSALRPDSRDMGRQWQRVVQDLPGGSHHDLVLNLMGVERQNASPRDTAKVASFRRVLAES